MNVDNISSCDSFVNVPTPPPTLLPQPTIKVSSRVSKKIGNDFFTFEYTEERTVNPTRPIEEQRMELWRTCHAEVDKQIVEIMNQFK
jgi:hypothetical protein